MSNSWQVDVFSFGIAMWEILTGEEPYVNMHCGAIIGKLSSYYISSYAENVKVLTYTVY